MARIRTIKPEFWSAEQILECSRNARLLFVGLWNFCDDRGRHKNSARQIKAEIFPGDDDVTRADVTDWLEELRANGLIFCYVVEDQEFIQVTGWHHQRIDKPQDPRHPDPETGQILDSFLTHSANVRRTLPPDRIGKERIGEEGIGKDPTMSSSHSRASTSVGEDEVFEHWREVHDHPRARFDDKRRRAVRRMLGHGYSVEDLKLAVDGNKLSPHHQGQNRNGTVYDGLELICRDAEHVDQFIAAARKPAKLPDGNSAAALEARGRAHVEDFVNGT